MKQHDRYYPDDLDEPVRCKLCEKVWPCPDVQYHQVRCGCWKTTKPSRKPWYYKRGDWTSWKPISRGGDEWCRWTLVLGIGPLTGVFVIPLWTCRGCDFCGPEWLDGMSWNMHHRQ